MLASFDASSITGVMALTAEQEIKRYWLVRLRFGAIAAEIAVFLLARYVFSLNLPLEPLLGCIALTAITNLVLLKNRSASYEQLIGSTLVVDILNSTALLYFYGGYTNPFSTLYFVYVTVAAFLLGAGWTWSMFFLSGLCFILLFFFHVSIPELEHQSAHGHLHDGFSLHLQGMLVGFILIGALISYFLTRISKEVARKNQELLSLREKQLLENKLIALATLSAGAAHELATPLGTISLIADDLKEDPSSDDLSKDLDLMRKELSRCKQILDKMRGQGGDLMGELFEEINSQEIIDYLEQTFPHELKRITINIHLPALITLKRSLLESVAALIKNALQATPREGQVTLRIEDDRDGGVAIVVQDNGPGMDEATLQRLGEPFFTTKETGQGTGLGLFLVHVFARRVGGIVTVQSTLGSGTTVTLTVPQRSGVVHG